MLAIYKLYSEYYSHKKSINKKLYIAVAIYCAYIFISCTSRSETIDLDRIGMPWIYVLLYLGFMWLFHKLVGKFWILKYRKYQTRIFQRDVMKKNMKCVGERGSGKDVTEAGMASNFITNSKETIAYLMYDLEVVLYQFDLERIRKYIKENITIFNTASTVEKKEIFLATIKLNNLFLKKKYENNYEEILNDYEKTKKCLRTSNSQYIISDSVNFAHVIDKLYDYMYYAWRLEIDIWLIVNQPFIQSYNFKTKEIKMAVIYSPDLRATMQRKVKTVEDRKTVEYINLNYMLAEDFIAVINTENDIWENNIDPNVRGVILDRGSRWYEVAQRHINGEHIMVLRNGQVAGRTAKVQRDLEESFFSITRLSKIDGGEKRIFFIKLLMWLFKYPLKIAPELKKRLSLKIKQLEMSGWLNIEVVFSRTESINYNAESITLSRLLDRDNPLYMQTYQTTLVFDIRDCFGKYNTHYLRFLADKLTKNSKAALLDLPLWNEALELTEEEIMQMNYDTVDIFGLEPSKRYAENPKYQKVEKENNNRMRL